MRFFSVFDMLLDKTKSQNMTMEDMYSFFRVRKIRKSEIEALQRTSYIPNDTNLKEAIYEFLGMSELEVQLAMGHIPSSYRDSYFDNISRIAELLESKEEKEKVQDPVPYFENKFGCLYNDDCIRVMKSMPEESVDLIFADPPFNLGKKYDPGIADNLTMSDYINWTYQWIDECIKILKPGGRIYIYNIPKWCVYISEYLSETLTFSDWIAVDMKFSLPIANRLYPAHYGLVCYIKGVKAKTFNNQRIPLQVCRHCGGEIRDYGGYKGKMNPKGVNVSDVWTDIYPVRHKGSKNRKYNELSVKLLDRVISMGSNEGDTVFDPFGGSGTTYAVAQLLNRKWIGCELGDCEVIKERLIHKDKDEERIKKVHEESGCLFTPKTEALRKKNGFWLCEDVTAAKSK